MNQIYLKPLDETCDNPQLHEATKLFLTMNKMNHSRDELHYILNKLEQLSYFKQFVSEKLQKGTKKNDILELCSRLRMEYFKGGEVLFKENDTSNDKLYIIYYGEVILMRQKKMDQLITLQRQNSEVPQIPFKMTQILAAKKFTNKLIKQHNIHKEITISREEKNNLEMKYGECVRILTDGMGFGDKALVENIPRTLTVACYSLELFIIVLKKDDFLMYQMTFEKTKREKQTLMFNIFKNVNNEYSSQRLESMIYSCETITYERGSQLTIEDIGGNAFYVIINGDITMYKKVDSKNIPLCIISQGHIFGEEIIINQNGCYEYTSCVTSLQATVIVIDAQEFIHKFPEECNQQLVHDYKPKHQNRMKLLNLLISKQQQIQNNDATPDKLQLIADIEEQQQQSIKTANFIENSEKQRQIKLNLNFLTKYSNPSIQNFCIKSIVEREKVFSKQTIIKQQGEIEQNNGLIKEFNFGQTSNDAIKRKRFLFENKLNIKRSQQNFLTPQGKILQLSVKRDIIKSFRQNNKKSMFLSQFSIQSFNATPKTQTHRTSKFDSYSTHVLTEEKQ